MEDMVNRGGKVDGAAERWRTGNLRDRGCPHPWLRASRRSVLALAGSALLLALSACEPVPPDETYEAMIARSRASLPPEMREKMLAYWLAYSVSENCRKDFRINTTTANEFEGSLWGHLYQNGFKNPLPSTKAHLLPASDYEIALAAYVQRRKIDMDDQESWCRAGYAEFEEDSLIGEFMRNAP